VLEVDELRSFVFRSKDKVWVWIAMNRETREIVASACGDRTEIEVLTVIIPPENLVFLS